MKLFYRFRGWLLSKRRDADRIRVAPVGPYGEDSFRDVWKEFRWVIVAFLVALIILLSDIFSYGQGVKVGERVPEGVWGSVYAEGRIDGGAARLSDLKGQVVVLDFWATWCAPCVMMIPRMDSLQRQFAGKVRFIGVAYQREGEVRRFMERLEEQRGRHYALGEVYGDTVLGHFFPHSEFPHFVWINPSGAVAGITGFQAVTAENMEKVLQGGTLGSMVAEGADLPYDYHRPMLLGGNGGDGHNLLYHSLLTSYTPGLHVGLAIVNDSVRGKKITCKNNAVHQLFELAWSDSGRNFNRQNTRYLVADSSRIMDRKDAGQAYRDWLARGNGFCYELQVPRELAPGALHMMRQDLERYFTQYSASVVREKRQCLVLVRTRQSALLQTSAGTPDVQLDRFGWRVTNCTLGILCERLNYYQVFTLPVVDETGLNGPVDLEVAIRQVSGSGGADIGALNKELAPYGLRLTQAERSREVLIIQDRKP